MTLTKEKRRRVLRILLLFLLACAVVYRVQLMRLWLAHTLDDDQALMWDATAAYAHFMFPEPFFWGQPYGFMLESLAAVPLYWLGVPLNIALPAATTFLGAAAYLWAAFILNRDDHPGAACAVVAFYLLMSWRWDILTGVPRCFISGMSLTPVSAVLLSRTKTRTGAGLAAFFCVLGVTMTSTAAMIAATGGLWVLLNIRQQKRKIPAFLLGGLAGGAVWYLARHFYTVNPQYRLHNLNGQALSGETFTANLGRLPKILSDFIFLNSGWIVIVLFLLLFPAVLLLRREKAKRKTFIMLLAQAVIFLLLLAVRKTGDYSDTAVTFSQSRMFLCLTYSLLVVFCGCMAGKDAPREDEAARQIQNGQPPETPAPSSRLRAWAFPALAGLCALLIPLACLMKTNEIKADLRKDDKDSLLKTGYVTQVYKVDRILEQCGQVEALAKQTGSDTVITYDRRALSYAFEALHYGEYTVYNTHYDRRTWTYLSLTVPSARRCILFHGITKEAIRDYDTFFLPDDRNRSVIQYLKDEYGYPARGE